MLTKVGIAALIAAIAFAAALVGMIVYSSKFPPNQQIEKQSEENKSADETIQITSADDRMASYTLALAIFSGGLLAVAALQIWLLIRAEGVSRTTAEAAKVAATEAANANRLSGEVLVADQRPWVSVHVTPKSDLTYAANGNAIVKFGFHMENVGRTPALFTRIDPAIFPIGVRQPHVELQRVCDTARARSVRPTDQGFTVFPTAFWEYEITLPVLRSEIDKAIPGNGLYSLMLVGCVSYSFGLATGIHVTEFTYSLDRKFGDGSELAIGKAFDAKDGSVANEQFRFVRYPSGNRAD